MTAITNSSVTVSWNQIPCLEQNGVINYYMVVAEHANTSLSVSVRVNDNSATIEGLLVDTYYDIEVYAHNIVDGPSTRLEEGVVTGSGELAASYCCRFLPFKCS